MKNKKCIIICSKCSCDIYSNNYVPKIGRCRDCYNAYCRARYVKIYPLIKEKESKRKADFYLKNKDFVDKRNKKYRQSPIGKLKEAKKRKEHYYSIFINTPELKIVNLCRVRLREFLKLKGKNKTFKFSQYIGCTKEQLKTHLESQFKEGMTWQNHGMFGWHIDHIIPLSSAKSEEEIYKLCHYTNLQPLWAKENLQKNNKIIEKKAA